MGWREGWNKMGKYCYVNDYINVEKEEFMGDVDVKKEWLWRREN